MTYDHQATTLHVADLEREIAGIQTERRIARFASTTGNGVLDRVRRGIGRALIAAGTSLAGTDRTLGANRA